MSTQINLAPSDPYITPDIVPGPGPAVAGVVETTITASEETIVSGTTTINAETYNGAIPGPTLRLNVGDTAIIRLVNNLPHPTGIHWHGIELTNSSDGTEVTQSAAVGAFSPPPAPAPAGGTYLYKFKVPRPGIYWYHPHHHNSTNRVFRGLYGMIVVSDPNETTLEGNTLPTQAETRQIVLSDITVCVAPPNPDAYAALAGAEWLSGLTAQPGPLPATVCQSPTAVDDDGMGAPPGGSYGPGDVPSLMAMAGRVNEGQSVLTNGVAVGGRAGTPAAPGAVAAGAYKLPVLSGQGLRLQFVNCATTRYFRLRLTYHNGVTGQQVNLVRVGGEGGLLDSAVLEGLTPPIPAGTYDPKYDAGEILLPPSARADVVVAIPAGLAVGTVLTLWTRDFRRLGAGGGPWAGIPTVPVMHLEITGAVVGPAYTITGGANGIGGTALRTKPGFPGSIVSTLGAANASLLTPAGGFVAPKFGMSAQEIQLTSGTPSVDGVAGTALHGPPPYPNSNHIGSTRYAEKGRRLELTVRNATDAHHPFHLHGFSMQPLDLTRPGNPTYTWGYREFRDSIDVPANYKLRFRVELEDRPLQDGVTAGGNLGRWLFHCHIFFHHHRGMISELVVTDGTGKERPYVDVGGSWAYAPSGGSAVRTGTFVSREGNAVTLAATYGTATGIIGPLGTVIVTGPGRWSWTNPIIPDGIYYVYITGTDTVLGLVGQAVFRLKVGAPDDGADNGDPHIHTVDGKRYDFQAAGEFVLLRDRDGMEVQTRQTPVLTANPIVDSYTGLKSCVSLNTAVAARVGSHWISYQPGQKPGEFTFYLDGRRNELTPRGVYLDGHRVSGVNVNGAMALRVDYSHLAVLIATPLFWDSHNLWYLNISISRTHATEGLMGVIPGNTWLPLLASGASVGPMPKSLAERYATLYGTFANAWRITDRTSLFYYEKGTSTESFTDRDWPAGEPPCNLKPQFEIPGWVIPEGVDVDLANQVCERVTDEGLKKDCVFDVATTGDKSFARAYRITQDLKVKGTAVQVYSPKPGEFVAIVSRLTKGRCIPKGKVILFVDGVKQGPPIDLDCQGHAHWKGCRLNKAAREAHVEFIPCDKKDADASSSPGYAVGIREAITGGDGGGGHEHGGHA